ncbi:MAG: septal ring lytic transglycosylase RlpA family protein [Dongiaceae bacterium]
MSYTILNWPRIRARGCVLVLALAAAGCAETELVIDRTKLVTRSPAEAPGAYKIGQPYTIGGVWYYPAENYEYNETGVASWYGAQFHGKTTANGETYDMNALTAAHKTLPMPSLVRVTNLENGRAVVLRVNDRGPFAQGRIIDVSRRGAQLLGFEIQGTARVRVDIMADESRILAARAQSIQESAVAAATGTGPRAAPTTVVTSETLAPGSVGGAPAAGPATAPSPPTPRLTTAEPAPANGEVVVYPVRQTRLFIQAGAFAEIHNAQRLTTALSRFGRSEMIPTRVGGQQYYRVRLGPIATVEEADRLLAQVVQAGHPEARLVVD